jgi:hypothetical protein
MNILYLSDQDLDNGSGVSQKIMMQASQWAKSGHEVSIISLISLSLFSVDGKRLTEPEIGIKRKGIKIFFQLIASTWKLGSITKNMRFDLAYMRFRPYAPFLIRALKRKKLVVEINSYDLEEYRLSSKLYYWYNRLFRQRFLRGADAFVFVSEELKNKYASCQKPSTVIANGIDTAAYPFLPEVENERPTLVFIGSPNQPWHGIDKIREMATHFLSYRFFIIGIEGEATQNVRYFGYLSKEESTKIIMQCDIGIGTLALFKKGLTEASPLKTRQYLACGLPVIYAYKDTDIPDNSEFVLELENCEDNLDYVKIEQFAKKAFGNRRLREEARAFAMQTLNYAKKEEVRLNFFKEIAGGA